MRTRNHRPSHRLYRREIKNIKDHLGDLPQEQLQVLTLMYFQGKSGQEVADELSISTRYSEKPS